MSWSRVPEPAITLQVTSSRSEMVLLSLDQIVDPALSLFHVQNLVFSTNHGEILFDAPLNLELRADRRVVRIRLLEPHCHRIRAGDVDCDQERHIRRPWEKCCVKNALHPRYSESVVAVSEFPTNILA